MIDKVLASGSKANCYKISNGLTNLLIECGLPVNKIKAKLDYKLQDIDGCIITHFHKDHSYAVNYLINLGVECYMTKETADYMRATGAKIIQPGKQFKVGTFTIMPFRTEHCPGSVGYLIYSNPTNEKLLFLTDTYYSKYQFKDLNYIMIECNYEIDILKNNLENGIVHPAVADRLYTSHFSLQNVKDFLRANDLRRVQEIYLIHLSKKNADPDRFKKEIQALTGKIIHVC